LLAGKSEEEPAATQKRAGHAEGCPATKGDQQDAANPKKDSF